MSRCIVPGPTPQYLEEEDLCPLKQYEKDNPLPKKGGKSNRSGGIKTWTENKN